MHSCMHGCMSSTLADPPLHFLGSHLLSAAAVLHNQVAAGEALARAEALVAELRSTRGQLAEVQAAADADRQQLAARHMAHIQVQPGPGGRPGARGWGERGGRPGRATCIALLYQPHAKPSRAGCQPRGGC